MFPEDGILPFLYINPENGLDPFSYRCREGNFGAEAYFLENHYRKAPHPALQQ